MNSISLSTRVFHDFCSNIDVGKTVIIASVCQAAAMITAKKESPPTPVHYIKPIQTGELLDVDFVKKHCDVKTSQLFFCSLAA